MTHLNRFHSSAICLSAMALSFAITCYAQVPAPTQGRSELVHSLDELAAHDTAERRGAIARITTKQAAIQRQNQVRARVLDLMGALPQRTPLNAKVLGTTELTGFRIEKILFESQPGFYVTALLYVPADAAAKHAAVIMAPGHGATGKAGDARTAAAFARNGFVVLSYDPIGQGERLQYPDPNRPGQSLAIRSTGEHGEAGLQPVLIGDAPARYWAWDGIRAVDYLLQRPEVDAARIGAFGCSGGGAITAMTAALDPRIAAAAVACYNTSFDALLSSIGPQDAEQSIPGFLAAGLDLPDWIEMVAPRPYAAVATYSDMFPFQGAVTTVQEARRFYTLFDPRAEGTGPPSAGDLAIPTSPALNADTSRKVDPGAPFQFLTGPGGHGALAPIMGDIIAFFVRNLQPGADLSRIKLPAATKPGAPSEVPTAALQVTPTGQVSSSYPAAQTVYSLNEERAKQLTAAKHVTFHGAALLASVRRQTAALAQPGTSRFETPLLRAGSGSIVLPDEGGASMRGHLAVPGSTGRHAAVLLLVPDDIDGDSDVAQRNRRRFEELSRQGKVVLAITPRPSYPGTDDMKAPILGPFYLLSLRAELVGRTLLGLRTDDAIRAVDYLTARADVDPQSITAEGQGHMATVLEHAALLDHRLLHVTAAGGLLSYASLVQVPLPIGAPEDIVPGALKVYDLPQLREALGNRLTVQDLQSGGSANERYSGPLNPER